jgi:hypothetical protein
MTFGNNLIFYGDRLLSPSSTPKLEDHPLSFIKGCLFSIFAAGGRPSIRNWRARQTVVTRDTPNMGSYFRYSNEQVKFVRGKIGFYYGIHMNHKMHFVARMHKYSTLKQTARVVITVFRSLNISTGRKRID